MDAYILETLAAGHWRRGGETYWSLDDAREAAITLIRKSLARRVRILSAKLDLAAVDEVTPEDAPKRNRRAKQTAGAGGEA